MARGVTLGSSLRSGKTSSGFWRYITNALEADSIEIEVEVLGDIASVSQQYDIGVVLRSTGPGRDWLYGLLVRLRRWISSYLHSRLSYRARMPD